MRQPSLRKSGRSNDGIYYPALFNDRFTAAGLERHDERLGTRNWSLEFLAESSGATPAPTRADRSVLPVGGTGTRRSPWCELHQRVEVVSSGTLFKYPVAGVRDHGDSYVRSHQLHPVGPETLPGISRRLIVNTGIASLVAANCAKILRGLLGKGQRSRPTWPACGWPGVSCGRGLPVSPGKRVGLIGR